MGGRGAAVRSTKDEEVDVSWLRKHASQRPGHGVPSVKPDGDERALLRCPIA